MFTGFLQTPAFGRIDTCLAHIPLGMFLYLKYLCGSTSLCWLFHVSRCLPCEYSSESNGVPRFPPLLSIFQERGKEVVVCLWSPVGTILFQASFSSAILLDLLYNSVMSSSELRDRRPGFQLQWLLSLNFSFLLCKLCNNSKWHLLCPILQNYESWTHSATWKWFVGHQILTQSQMWEPACSIIECGLDKATHFRGVEKDRSDGSSKMSASFFQMILTDRNHDLSSHLEESMSWKTADKKLPSHPSLKEGASKWT